MAADPATAMPSQVTDRKWWLQRLNEPSNSAASIDRSDLIVGPVTPAITAELQETADAFLKVGLFPSRSSFTMPPGRRPPADSAAGTTA